MTGITTEDLVLRLRELLLQEHHKQQASYPLETTVATGSQSTSDLWKTAAATTATAVTSAMNGSVFQMASRSPPTSSAVGHTNSSGSISQAILNVLQGIRPRQVTYSYPHAVECKYDGKGD